MLDGRRVTASDRLKMQKSAHMDLQGETTQAVVSPCGCGQRPAPNGSFVRACSSSIAHLNMDLLAG